MAEPRNRGSTSGKPLPPLSESDIDRFWSKVEIGQSCWNWIGTSAGKGYGGLSYGPHISRRTLLAHRVAFTIANGPIPEGMTVSHLCHNRRCVRARHMIAEPIKANLGRSIVGEGHRDAKLTEQQVLDIRAAFDSGTRQMELVRRYGVNPGTISDIVRRQTWRYLPEGGVPSPR